MLDAHGFAKNVKIAIQSMYTASSKIRTSIGAVTTILGSTRWMKIQTLTVWHRMTLIGDTMLRGQNRLVSDTARVQARLIASTFPAFSAHVHCDRHFLRVKYRPTEKHLH